ncbi:MAG: DnaJ C-terminal domain-containing protein, partial [Patescibacteria group bacterium]
DMGDLGDILGGMFGFGSHNTKQRRGQDIQIDVELDFLEMVKGVTKKIRLYKHDKCTKCKGIGAEEGSKINTCQECGGQGRVQKAQRTIFGTVQSLATCAKCYGKGEVPEKSCSQCKGNGIEKIDKEIDVPIPAGISDTEGVRITGEGENPGREGKSGDLFLRIRVKQHPIFTREVNDILSTVEVPYSMLSLGGKIDVETVDGQGSLKIPSSTKPGTVFKLRGKGIPFMRSLGRGDHLITVQTKVEKNLSREQKKMIEQLRDSGL